MHSAILNRYPYPSSLYKYAMDLIDGNPGNSELLNITTNSSKWGNEHAGVDMSVKLSKNFFISGIYSKWTFGAVKRALHDIVNNNPDLVVHLVSPFADPGFINDIPVTVTIHDSPDSMFVKGLYRRETEPDTDYKRRMKMNRSLYNHSLKLPLICVNSEHVAKSLKEYGYNGETFVLYPAVSRIFEKLGDRTNLRKKLNLPTDRTLILSISIDEVRKNLEMVKNVMRETKGWASFVRIGSDIGAEFNFKDVDDSTLNMIYNACDLMFIPSLEEGFGNPVVEAFKVGIPVVASDIEVFREVAGDAAVFSDPNNQSELVSSIKEALSIGEELIAKGFERVKRYEMPAFEKQLKSMYARIAELS